MKPSKLYKEGLKTQLQLFCFKKSHCLSVCISCSNTYCSFFTDYDRYTCTMTLNQLLIARLYNHPNKLHFVHCVQFRDQTRCHFQYIKYFTAINHFQVQVSLFKQNLLLQDLLVCAPSMYILTNKFLLFLNTLIEH